MRYHAPPYSRITRLVDDVCELLMKCGGCYKEIDSGAMEHILIGMATGQFIYRKGAYFACWFMVNEDEIDDIKAHIRPANIRNGETMCVMECGCYSKNWMPEIVRKIRSKGKRGVHWHRSKKGWRHFASQKGAGYGQ